AASTRSPPRPTRASRRGSRTTSTRTGWGTGRGRPATAGASAGAASSRSRARRRIATSGTSWGWSARRSQTGPTRRAPSPRRPALEAQPDRLAEPRTAARAAGWYWHAHGINELCDRDDAVAVTEAVNGGRHGLEERLRLLGLAKAALGGPDVHA